MVSGGSHPLTRLVTEATARDGRRVECRTLESRALPYGTPRLALGPGVGGEAGPVATVDMTRRLTRGLKKLAVRTELGEFTALRAAGNFDPDDRAPVASPTLTHAMDWGMLAPRRGPVHCRAATLSSMHDNSPGCRSPDGETALLPEHSSGPFPMPVFLVCTAAIYTPCPTWRNGAVRFFRYSRVRS